MLDQFRTMYNPDLKRIEELYNKKIDKTVKKIMDRSS